MSSSVSVELLYVKELLNEGKIEEALQCLKDIEQQENLTLEELLKIQRYYFELYYRLGRFGSAFKFAKNLYRKSQKANKPLYSLLGLIFSTILIMDKPIEEYSKNYEKIEKLFESIPRGYSPEFQEAEVFFLIIIGIRHFRKGDSDLALDCYHKALKLIKRHDLGSYLIPRILLELAYSYYQKGENILTAEFIEKALSQPPKGESYGAMIEKADIYRAIGQLSYEKRDFDKALEYHKRGLEFYKKVKDSVRFSFAFFHIISVLITQKNIKEANKYLEQFKEYNEKYKSKIGHLLYQLSHAIILKSSSRMRSRTQAESILKKIIQETSYIGVVAPALVNLCDWYFEEFRISNQVEILDDIYLLIDHLQRIARNSNSFATIANLKLLQAKLALLQINITDARILLTEAQKIADGHGLQILAGEISKEHDRLLEELKLWESFKKEQTSAAERLKLASVNTVIERMQGRRAIEPPEIISEEPILLIIMGKDGVSYFNYSFIQNWDFDDLFSAFVSAFNTFSSEIFSKSIDRIKIDENVILIKPIEPYLICYVIKGQSYPAQKKLTRFSDSIRNNSEIWEALNKAAKTSEMLELDNPPSLGNTVNEIFIN